MTLPSPPGPPPPGPPTPGQSGPSATPPRAGLPGRIWWSFFLVLLVWNAIALFGTAGNSVEVPYSTFLAQAQQDNVDQVTFNGQALAGTFRHAVQWPPASAAPASAAPASAVPGSSEAAPASPAPGSSEVATPGSSGE